MAKEKKQAEKFVDPLVQMDVMRTILLQPLQNEYNEKLSNLQKSLTELGYKAEDRNQKSYDELLNAMQRMQNEMLDKFSKLQTDMNNQFDEMNKNLNSRLDKLQQYKVDRKQLGEMLNEIGDRIAS